MTSPQWNPATRSNPCPVCGKPDWYTVSADGRVALCRRESSGGKPKFDSSGAEYWVHTLWHDSRGASRGSGFGSPNAEPADPETLHRVYCSLLELLFLTPDHRAGLRRRGLSDAEIDAREYRSFPVEGRADLAQQLEDKHGAGVFAQITGLYVLGDKTWSIAGSSGTP